MQHFCSLNRQADSWKAPMYCRLLLRAPAPQPSGKGPVGHSLRASVLLSDVKQDSNPGLWCKSQKSHKQPQTQSTAAPQDSSPLLQHERTSRLFLHLRSIMMVMFRDFFFILFSLRGEVRICKFVKHFEDTNRCLCRVLSVGLPESLPSLPGK